MAPCVAIALPIAGRPWQRKNGAASALDEGSLARGHQVETSAERATRNMPGITVFPGEPRRLNSALSASSTPMEVVTTMREEVSHAQQQLQQEPQREPCSPLGCMFRPELTREEVVAVVSQVLCRPGFTLGAGDERLLLKSVRTGRIDVRTMSRILRWLAGERAARELRQRGIEFVGPKQSSPYTTGQGMTQLVKEIIARNGAGTRFIVCFSSRFDACSSAIAGALVNAAAFPTPGPAFDRFCPSPGSVTVSACGDGAISEDARTVSTCSSFDTEDEDDRLAPCAPVLSVDLASGARQAVAPEQAAAPKARAGGTAPGIPSRLVSVGGAKANNCSVGGGRAGAKRANGDNSSPRGGVVALLLDEKPKHRLCNGGGDGSGGGNAGTSGFGGGDSGVVNGMPVQEWVEAYGECEGPMLAAWVFPGQGR